MSPFLCLSAFYLTFTDDGYIREQLEVSILPLDIWHTPCSSSKMSLYPKCFCKVLDVTVTFSNQHLLVFWLHPRKFEATIFLFSDSVFSLVLVNCNNFGGEISPQFTPCTLGFYLLDKTTGSRPSLCLWVQTVICA